MRDTVTFILDDGTAEVLICNKDETPAERIARREEEIARNKAEEGHDCWEEAVPYESSGALGHGWECGVCGNFLQAG